jgi:uncharacterized protein (TIGR00725 family)
VKKIIKIGVIGPNKSGCSNLLYQFGISLGQSISKKNRVSFNGGARGFMEAISEGIKSSEETYFGQTIGILQGDSSKDANEIIFLAIPTGVGIARNIILINSSDIIISAGGVLALHLKLLLLGRSKRQYYVLQNMVIHRV